jgi:uncharacterized membrane protein
MIRYKYSFLVLFILIAAVGLGAVLTLIGLGIMPLMLAGAVMGIVLAWLTTRGMSLERDRVTVKRQLLPSTILTVVMSIFLMVNLSGAQSGLWYRIWVYCNAFILIYAGMTTFALYQLLERLPRDGG